MPHSGYDLIIYGQENIAIPSIPPQIAMGWIIVSVCTDTSPSCAPGIAPMVFNWGNGILDTNTNLFGTAYSGPPELDDLAIPMTNPPLYGDWPSYTGGIITGIAIDADAVVPPGMCTLPTPCLGINIYRPTGGSNTPTYVNAVFVIP